MALLQNTYIFVETETVENQVETTSHPTESGIPTSDTVVKKPVVISLSGKIVNVNKLTASAIIAKIKKWQQSGALLTYVGQAGTFKNMQIQSFPNDFNNKNYGGADFEMTLQEMRVAKKAYVKPKASTENIAVKDEPKELKVGDIVHFKGGAVYVSSDAKKSASHRGESDCRLDRIATHSWSIHRYHLISTDCNWGSSHYVYGWVDGKNISAISSNTNGSTNGGTQQVQPSTGAKYHIVKKGDTLWKLANVTYRSMNLSTKELLNNNPHAFSRKGNPRTMIIGAKLYLSSGLERYEVK